MKKITVLFLFLLTASIFVLGGAYWWITSGTAVDQNNGSGKAFVVQKGEGAGVIGNRLKAEGLIKSDLRFKIYLYLHQDIGKKIQAGSFNLNPGMPVEKIATTLTKGTNDQWVTIVEGLRQEEIGLQLVGAGFNFDFEAWNTAVKNQQLEGRLFPDTYLIPVNADLAKILTIFNKNYQKKVVEETDGAVTNSLKFSENDFLILASLVEREARSDTSRPVVAGIIIKRLEANWPLQVDASVQYAVANKTCLPLYTVHQTPDSACVWWKKSLTKEDLAINSPFNTYLNQGLPPAPICNPSLSSIKAVLNPTPSDFWFYLTGNDNQMHYGRTIEEHNLNVQKYLR